MTTLAASVIVAGDNDRKEFDRHELRLLAESIRDLGCLHPPTVRPLGDGRFEIVEGERRYRAMSGMLGWDEIPVTVADMDDATASRAMLVENLGRVDLDPLTEADAYQARIDRFGLTVAQVAEWAGVNPSRVSARLRLLKLVPQAQHLIRIGEMAPERGVAMSVLDSNRQRLCLEAMARENLSVYELRVMVERLKAEQEAEPLFDPDTFFQIETYVAHARQRGLGKVGIRNLMFAMADVLAANGLSPELVAAADALRAA